MSELTIVIDNWGHKELKEYLMSLNGILEVEIKNDKGLDIYLKYDSNFITPKIIKMEISLFLDFRKIPSILSFDKHPKFKTLNYHIIRDSLCCEYCFKGAIEDLFDINGIEKVVSNFNYDDFDRRERIIISLEYNPNFINIEQLKKIDRKLNI